MRDARPVRAFAFAAALVLAGCRSQWIQDAEHAEIVKTNLLVKTEPPGALVFLNGTRMDVSPVRIPIEYRHVLQQWIRQANYGEAIREDKSPVAQTLLAPVWLPASLVHGRQEMKRHVYEANRHVVTATLEGHREAEATVELNGEEEIEVLLKLDAAR